MKSTIEFKLDYLATLLNGWLRQIEECSDSSQFEELLPRDVEIEGDMRSVCGNYDLIYEISASARNWVRVILTLKSEFLGKPHDVIILTMLQDTVTLDQTFTVRLRNGRVVDMVIS